MKERKFIWLGSLQKKKQNTYDLKLKKPIWTGKSLLARQSSCPEEPNSGFFLKWFFTTITVLKDFAYVKHYYQKISISAKFFFKVICKDMLVADYIVRGYICDELFNLKVDSFLKSIGINSAFINQL